MKNIMTMQTSTSSKQLMKLPVVFILAMFFISSCGKEPVEETKLRPVRVLKVSPAQIGNVRTFSGTSKSEQQAQLSFRISGTVNQVAVKVGDKLNKGDLIAKLDSTTYDLQAEQAKASLAQAKAAQRNARSIYERTKSLYENNSASKSDLDAASSNAESANAQVRAANKALELAQLNVSYTRLVSQQDCAIASINIEVNENIANGTPVATVDCGSQIEVNIALPESLIAEVSNGQKVLVKFDAIPDQEFMGIISEVGIAATNTGATFPVTVTLDEANPTIRSGLAAEVTIEFANSDARSNIYLPTSAINHDNQSPYVFIAEKVVNESNDQLAVIKKRYVRIGELTSQGIIIHSGLKVDENIVIAGTKVIREGMQVLLK